MLQNPQERFMRIRNHWDLKIESVRNMGLKIVIWGSGSRAITFLNTYDLQNVVDFVVDINPDRQGTFMPKTGHPVKKPEVLKSYQPDIIIIVNPTYQHEIKEQAEQMGLNCEYWIL
ncbi:MAG: hypothetical protein ABR545_06735 [Cyclonatronaceae bacterium]